MKKRIIVIAALAIVAIVAAACVSQQAGADTPGGAATGELPELTRLVMGVVSLEDTEMAVNAEQADALLPLFKMVRALSESDSVAEVELEAVTGQIGDSLTEAQIASIDAMDLTMADMSATMEQLGLASASEGGERDTSGTGERPEGGEMGGQAPGGDENMTSEQIAEMIAERTSSGASMMAGGTELYDAVIDLLSERAVA